MVSRPRGLCRGTNPLSFWLNDRVSVSVEYGIACFPSLGYIEVSPYPFFFPQPLSPVSAVWKSQPKNFSFSPFWDKTPTPAVVPLDGIDRAFKVGFSELKTSTTSGFV